MNNRRFRYLVIAFMAVLLSVLSGQADAVAQQKKPAGKIPANVMATLKSKFPQAVIRRWTREQEGDIVLYDIEFKQAGRNFEIDIREDGSIENWEKAIALKDLPEAVKKAVDAMYPKSIFKEIMAVTAVKGGKEELEGYEIVLRTADRKNIEVMVAPDGKILEDSEEIK